MTSIEGMYPKRRVDKILPGWLTNALDHIGLLGVEEDSGVNRLGVPNNDLIMLSSSEEGGKKKSKADENEGSNLQWNPRINRRDFLRFGVGAAALALGGYSLYKYFERKRESIDEKSVDVTDIIKTLRRGEEFSLEKSLGDRWNPQVAKMWGDAKTKKGWNDESLRDMLLVARDSMNDLSQASSGLTEEEFRFKRVKLLFDSESDSAVTNTENGADILYINLLHDTPSQLLPNIATYTLPHEFSHVILTSNFRKREEDGLDKCPNIKGIRDEDIELQTRYFYPRDVIMVMQEVLADKLGLRLAEALDRKGEFVHGFEDYANRELNRYSKVLSGSREPSLTEITDIAGISVFARYIGNTELSDRLDEAAYGMINKTVRIKGREPEENSIRDEYKNIQVKLKNLSNVEFTR